MADDKKHSEMSPLAFFLALFITLLIWTGAVAMIKKQLEKKNP